MLMITHLPMIYNPNEGDTMVKGQDKQKAVKKKSEKTLKDKRAEKKAKKS